MTIIPKQQKKHCFIACHEDKVNAGLCDCINRIRNESLSQPIILISTICTCTESRETPMINDRYICAICNKPITPTE